MFNNIPPSGFPQIDLSQDVKNINAELSSMTSTCTNIITDITAETATVTGNPISLSDALATDAISVVARIEPEQDLHGYEKPWSGGANVNKLNYDDFSPAYTGVTVTKNNGSMTVSGTVGRCTAFIYEGFVTTLPAGTYTLSCIVDDVTNSQSQPTFYGVTIRKTDATLRYVGVGIGTPGLKQRSFTLEEGESLVKVDFNINDRDTVLSSECSITAHNFMINSGSTIADFVPFANICPISGMTEVNVTTTDGTDTNTITASLGTTIYGGSVDLTEGSGSVEYASVDIGDITWSYSESSAAMYKSVNSFENLKIPDENEIFPGICSVFKSIAATDRRTTDPVIYVYSGFVYIRNSGYTDPDAFKTAMDGQTICYELATPTTLSITPTTLAMLEGENTISTDAEEVSIEYIKNTLVGRVRRLEEQ